MKIKLCIVTYETVVTKKLSLDIDQVIDLVVEDTKKDADGEAYSICNVSLEIT